MTKVGERCLTLLWSEVRACPVLEILYVAFHVKFPPSLPPDVVEKLRELLPGADMPEEYDADAVEEHFMDEADLRHFGKGGAAMQNSEYDSDDEKGAQGVQCQQS